MSPDSELSVKVRSGVGSLVLVVLVLRGSFMIGCLFISDFYLGIIHH
jgi:hypothetical protein